MTRSIVVGVDGSSGSREAVRWAAVEARRRGLPLRIVHAWLSPLVETSVVPVLGVRGGTALRTEATKVVTRGRGPGRHSRAGHRGRDLAGPRGCRSRPDRGGRRRRPPRGGTSRDGRTRWPAGRFGRRRGRVARRLPGGRGPRTPGQRREARARRRRWRRDPAGAPSTRPSPLPGGPPSEWWRCTPTGSQPQHRDFAERVAETSGTVTALRDHLVAAEQDAKHLVEQQVSAARQRYPEVRVEIRVLEGQAAQELVRASAGASLVVVGKSGRRAPLRPGSTSHTLVHHAHCPVLVDR